MATARSADTEHHETFAAKMPFGHPGAGAEPEVTAAGAAISDGAYTLFVADFSDTETAWSAFQELKALEEMAPPSRSTGWSS